MSKFLLITAVSLILIGCARHQDDLGRPIATSISRDSPDETRHVDNDAEKNPDPFCGWVLPTLVTEYQELQKDIDRCNTNLCKLAEFESNFLETLAAPQLELYNAILNSKNMAERVMNDRKLKEVLTRSQYEYASVLLLSRDKADKESRRLKSRLTSLKKRKLVIQQYLRLVFSPAEYDLLKSDMNQKLNVKRIEALQPILGQVVKPIDQEVPVPVTKEDPPKTEVRELPPLELAQMKPPAEEAPTPQVTVEPEEVIGKSDKEAKIVASASREHPLAPVMPSGGTFAIILASFRQKQRADRYIEEQELKRLGVHACIWEVNLPEKGRWNRVCIGGFNTLKEAKNYTKQLGQKGISYSFITKITEAS